MNPVRAAILTLSVLSSALLAPAAFAGGDNGAWYGRLNFGTGSLGDSDVTLSSGATSATEFGSGSLFGGAIGKRFGALRVEGEVAYRSNDIDSISLPGYRSGDDAGDFASLGLGLNLLYEVDLFGSKKAVSYFGGGLVYLQEIDIDLMTPAGDEVSFSNNDFGFQLIAGARYEVSPVWDLFAELRYFDAGEIELDPESSSGPSVTAGYENTSVVFGIGYRF